MPQFVTVQEVRRGRFDVFAYIIDLSKWTSFKAFGPLPGIADASLPEGQRMGSGARVCVHNTDGSIHHEIVIAFEPGRFYGVRMELSPPASLLMDRIEEYVDLADTPGGGTRMTRTFIVTPRSRFTVPLVWIITRWLLRRAVFRHNDRVAEELEGRLERPTA